VKRRRCVVCKRYFWSERRRSYCSEECRRKRMLEWKRAYSKSLKGKLAQYKTLMYQQWKDKPKEFLILRLRQSLIRIEVLSRILKEFHGIDVMRGADEGKSRRLGA